MIDLVEELYKSISSIDLAFSIITILSIIKCYRKGFVLSILAMSKWLFAYIITLIIFPRAKPYLKGVIDNEYILDLVLGVSIFIIVIFLVLLISKGISKAVKYTGLGTHPLVQHDCLHQDECATMLKCQAQVQICR